MDEQLVGYIKTILSKPIPVDKNIFDLFLEKCQWYYEQPAHSLSEIKDRLNTKKKGDIFEEFALLYFKHIKNFQEIWLLKDVPKEKLKELKLKRRDYGIDLIGIDKQGRDCAIQVKYRKRTKYKTKIILGWKQLSTFYALVSRSGPFYKHIVFTNAHYIRHIGKRSIKDMSICYGTLKNLKYTSWALMSGSSGNKLKLTKTVKLNREQLREARLKALSKGNSIKDKIRYFNKLSEDTEKLILSFVGYKTVCERVPFGDGEQTYTFWVKCYNWKCVCKTWKKYIE